MPLLWPRSGYHPIIDILKSSFGVEDQDADSDITEKVKRGLTILGIDETSTLPYLLELLSVKDSGVDKYPYEPASKEGPDYRCLAAIDAERIREKTAGICF